MSTQWEHRYAQRTQRMEASAIRELLKLTEQPDMISFSGGLPAPEVFPVEPFRAAADRVLRDNGPQALQYGATEGYRPLREWVAQRMTQGTLGVTPDNVLITTGSQQGLDLIGRLFVNSGDRIIVEAPSYVGALQIWNSYDAEYIQVPMDEEGMRIDALESALRAGPKFIYTLPNFQNPSGVTLSLERRHRLVELADTFGVPIVEDDPYGELRFAGEPLPSLLELDDARCDHTVYDGNVIYLGTFSKILAPGLRLAWTIAPPSVAQRLVLAKQGADLHSSTFNQMAAYELARDGFLDQHIPLIRRVYRERRDAMLQAMTDHFPPGVRWTEPEGGLFLWVTLPEGVDATEVLRLALDEKIAFVPGANFFPNGGGENTLRLNFSNASPEKIREGIARLGGVLHTVMEDELALV